MPTSDKQLAANRANAARSTGPRTPAGKSRSAANARTHGLTAAAFSIIRLEDSGEFADLKDDALAVYQPANPEELFAVERIALCKLAILRAARLEAGLFTSCLNVALNDDGVTPFFGLAPELKQDRQTIIEQNRNYALADGFHRMARQSNSWSLFLRYQAQAERQYRRAIEEFTRLKRLRHEFPNEPILDPQPEQNEEPAPLPVEPISPQPSTVEPIC